MIEFSFKCDTEEELEVVRRFLARDAFTMNNGDKSEIDKQKKSEYDKQRYLDKKNSTVKNSEKEVKNGENEVKKVESTVKKVESTKEEREEERAVSPLDSPLPFSPNTPYPITPLIPSSQREEEREENFLAVATAETEIAPAKQKPTVNDFEYWHRAFGPNAEMAMRFWERSGIAPVKSEFGHWQKDLKELAEAGITVEQMENAIDRMKIDKLTIKSPKSVLAVARSLASPQLIDPKKITIHDMAEELRSRGVMGKEMSLMEMAFGRGEE